MNKRFEDWAKQVCEFHYEICRNCNAFSSCNNCQIKTMDCINYYNHACACFGFGTDGYGIAKNEIVHKIVVHYIGLLYGRRLDIPCDDCPNKNVFCTDFQNIVSCFNAMPTDVIEQGIKEIDILLKLQ